MALNDAIYSSKYREMIGGNLSDMILTVSWIQNVQFWCQLTQVNPDYGLISEFVVCLFQSQFYCMQLSHFGVC